MHYWEKQGRHDLPWRKTKDPYKILVSEIMLQQTQVTRVREKYIEFLKAFPTIHFLAESRLADVLRIWSGLGYNRRGKFLRECAIAVVTHHGGKLPHTRVELEKLPGIGHYTAGAVRVFAYNQPDVFIETNIRSVFIHEFFDQSTSLTAVKLSSQVHDSEIVQLVEQSSMGMDPRTWYWALMDYGAHIKATKPNPSRRSTHHTTQSQFEGSLRQVRGAILKQLTLCESQTFTELRKVLSYEMEQIEEALEGLAKEGMVVKRNGKWNIA